MEAKNHEAQWVLRGLRRNGILSWRPNLREGAFRSVTGHPEEKWAQDMPEGSARLRASWLEDRLSWLDPQGRPVPPEWSLSEVAHEVSDLIEWNSCRPEEEGLELRAFDWPIELSKELVVEAEVC